MRELWEKRLRMHRFLLHTIFIPTLCANEKVPVSCHTSTSVPFRLYLRRRHVCLFPEYSHAVLLQCRSLRMFAKVSTGIDFLPSCRQVKEKGIYPFATLAPPLRKKWSSCRSYIIQTKRALQDHYNRIIFFHGGWQVLSQPVLVPSFVLNHS